MEGFSSEDGEEEGCLSVLGSGAGVEGGGWGSWVLWMRLQYLDGRLESRLEGRNRKVGMSYSSALA